MIVNVHINRRSPGREQFHIRDRELRVLYSDTYVRLSDVELVVVQKGSHRAKVTGEHNTHAYARGTLIEHDSTTVPDTTDLVGITYNPFQDVSFIRTDTGEPVSYTAALVGYKGKVYAQKETLI